MVSNKMNILLIEDDHDMQHAVRAMLEPLGYQVMCCSTGSEGMKQLQKEPPDLLLLDIMLSSPSEGLQIAKTLKIDSVFKTLPVVLISSIDPQNGELYFSEIGCTEMPADAFLEKPLNAKKLRDTVQQLLGKEK